MLNERLAVAPEFPELYDLAYRIRDDPERNQRKDRYDQSNKFYEIPFHSGANSGFLFLKSKIRNQQFFFNLCAFSNSAANSRVSRFSRICARRCSSASRASRIFFLLVSAISRHMEYGLLAMRVISRSARPPASRTGTWSPKWSTSAAASAVEIICGRWLIQAQSSSWVVASISAARAPIFSSQERNSALMPS